MAATLDLAAGQRLYEHAIANGVLRLTTNTGLAREVGRMLLTTFNGEQAAEVEARDAITLIARREPEDRRDGLTPGELLAALREVRKRNGTTRALPAPKDCPRCADARGFEIVVDGRGVERARRCTHEPRLEFEEAVVAVPDELRETLRRLASGELRLGREGWVSVRP